MTSIAPRRSTRRCSRNRALVYRRDGTTSRAATSRWPCTARRALATRANREYYLLATDKDGLPLASRGDADTPLRIAVPEPAGGVLSSPWFWVPVGVLVVGGAVATTIFFTQQRDTAAVSIRVTE